MLNNNCLESEVYMKRKIYESPLTTKTIVSLENNICAASADIENPNSKKGKIEDHPINQDFNFNFNEQVWDQK